MGRIKSVPNKKDFSLGQCSLSTIGELRPFIRKMRKTKKTPKEPGRTYSLNFAQEAHRNFYLGDIKIGRTSNVLPGKIEVGRIEFNVQNEEQQSVILILGDEHIVVYPEFDIFLLRDLVQDKQFLLEIYTQGEALYFKIFLIAIPLPRPHRTTANSIKNIFKILYNMDFADLAKTKPQSQNALTTNELNQVYAKLMENKDWKQHTFTGKDLALLKPSLRPYQEQSLQWMIHRENEGGTLKDDINPAYEKVTLRSGRVVFVEKFTALLENEPPVVSRGWKGGILADEMGLGKTIEVLALILSHQKTPSPTCTVSDNMKQLTVATGPKRQLSRSKDPPERKTKKIKKAETVNTGKSNTFKALEAIYTETLSQFCTTKPRARHVVNPVQCICGSASTNDTVKCVTCDKLQHISCLAWRPELGPYKCPQCWEAADLIESKATLIVVPATLSRQWCREMETHLKYGLKVLHYEGCTNSPVYPAELLDYDIVITTYSVLKSDIKLTETNTSISRRQQRKYWPILSPIVRVLWWRICLDEAQTVELPMISKITKKISACHKWAVTGTPMSKGIADIFALIDYLQMEPYNDLYTWNNVLYYPYVAGNTQPMYDFLSKILWRTSKSAVLNQINIPEQSEKLHMLEFSAVEKFFYNREHEVCSRNFLQIASKFEEDITLQKMNRKHLKQLMQPLVSLRQACSDASTVRGKGRYLSLKRDAYSMKDLLEALILKNKCDCEEALRLLVSSNNGLAGTYLLMNDPEQAIAEYRKVLQLAAKFSLVERDGCGKIDVDKLPLIHAMHNLADVLETHQPKMRTIRDSSLRKDCTELEKQYIEKTMKETGFRSELYNAATAIVTKHQSEFILSHGEWYSDGFDWVSLNGLEKDLISRVSAAAGVTASNLEFYQIRSLLRKTYNWHVSLEQTRDELCSTINSLYRIDPETKQLITSEYVVEKAVECHLRPVQAKATKQKAECPICVANAELISYEKNLYNTEGRAEMCEKKTLEESVLRCLLALLKSKNCEADIIKDGETHLLLLEALKKEFKEISKLWTLLARQVCAQDEVEICKVRLQFKEKSQNKTVVDKQLKMLSYEQNNIHEHINLISPEEVCYQELTLRSDESQYNTRLEALLGRRNYLNTLRQQQFEGYAPDPCPICQSPLVKTWAILSCAHTYCLECSEALINKTRKQDLQCSVCRSKQSIQDLAYINSCSDGAAQDEDETKISVLGNYCKKIESVVQLVLSLRRTTPTVQVLIFSSWTVVLKLLGKALEQNHVTLELVDSSTTFAKRIQHFKDPLNNITALLIPIEFGSKGLNLIEATHVILMEPLLDTANELQAIGRVHRIGQTKKTVVHRFVIRDTIEESLYKATCSNSLGWEKGRVTVGQLRSLFESAIDENESQ
uniref:RING-type domain-containing protein n=1 Tax=Dendroctonus ponderosae TaxID=77166 RepID=A0AAR5Q841_DENPD